MEKELSCDWSAIIINILFINDIKAVAVNPFMVKNLNMSDDSLKYFASALKWEV